MPEPLTLPVAAVEGRRVFAIGDDGRPMLPVRYVGCDPMGAPLDGGEPLPATRTADGRVILANPLYRSALLAGDLALLTTPAPAAKEHV